MELAIQIRVEQLPEGVFLATSDLKQAGMDRDEFLSR
jgi:hypothetical protein